MKDYEQLIRTALEKADAQQAEAAAREAFADPALDEDALAWVAARMYENDIRPAFDLLSTFADRFPGSLHLCRIYFADLLARANQYDDATDQARAYLRQAQDLGALPGLAENRVIQDGVSRAVLLLTAAYTELGARSYSARVLIWGGRFKLGAGWIEPIRGERLRLVEELKDPANGRLDAKWEQFFASGRHADDLCKIAMERGFPLMARRLDLLEGNFRFNASFKVDDQEILLLVHTLPDGGCVLQ